MLKILLIAFVILASFQNATGQKGTQLSESSIVKDTSGTIIPYSIWSRLLLTGRYKIKNENKEDSELVIIRLSDEEYQKVLEKMPKPKESKYFRTGASFSHFKTTDINGNKINTKNLAGRSLFLIFGSSIARHVLWKCQS